MRPAGSIDIDARESQEIGAGDGDGVVGYGSVLSSRMVP